MKTPRPRALTYTEMMNGGRQQLDPEAHQRELDVAKAHALNVPDAVVHLADEEEEAGRAQTGDEPLPPGTVAAGWPGSGRT